MSDGRLGAAETREFQIRILSAFIETARTWVDLDGEIAPDMIRQARAWWMGAYEAAMIGPCAPSFISPSWMAIVVNHHPQLMTYCRNTLAELKAERPKL